MASRTTYPEETPRTQTHRLYAHFTGGGTGNATLVGPEALNGEIVSITRTGVGTHKVVFRYDYPRLKDGFKFSNVGAQANLNGRCTTVDVTAKTATFQFCVGASPTDIAATDVVYVTWAVRNSERNE